MDENGRIPNHLRAGVHYGGEICLTIPQKANPGERSNKYFFSLLAEWVAPTYAKCTRQTAARDEAREKESRCVMRSREGGGGGSTTLSSRSELSAQLSHPAPQLPSDKMPPLKHHLYSSLPPSSLIWLVGRDGSGRASRCGASGQPRHLRCLAPACSAPSSTHGPRERGEHLFLRLGKNKI